MHLFWNSNYLCDRISQLIRQKSVSKRQFWSITAPTYGLDRWIAHPNKKNDENIHALEENQFEGPCCHQNCNTKFTVFVHFSFIFWPFCPMYPVKISLDCQMNPPGDILGTLEHIYEMLGGFRYPYQMRNHGEPKTFFLKS